jgi:hypothetical protein
VISGMELPGELRNLTDTVFPDVFILDWMKVFKKH